MPEIGHFEDLGIDWRIILKWIFRKWDGVEWIVLTRIQVVGSFERGAENSGSLKFVEFLYELRTF